MGWHEVEDTNTRVALLIPAVEQLSGDMRELTVEMRRTNEALQAQHVKQVVIESELERVQREVWAPDGSSRIRNLQLRLNGMYAIGVFIATVMGTQLLGLLLGWWKVGK